MKRPEDLAALMPCFLGFTVIGALVIAGLRSVHAWRGGTRILVAALADIIKSKKAAGRPRDLAVLPILEKVFEEATRRQKGPAGSAQERE
jgi:hypothetical protein